jgi:hypothetical protein
MLIVARTILLCIFLPWLITFAAIVQGKGIIGLPYALASGLLGICITPIRWPVKIVLSAIYLPLAFFILVPYSISIVCDYNECERLPDGRPAP